MRAPSKKAIDGLRQLAGLVMAGNCGAITGHAESCDGECPEMKAIRAAVDFIGSIEEPVCGSRYVTVRMTVAEAEAIATTSDDGVDSGYFYVEDDGSDTGRGGKRAFAAWERGYAKLVDAINAARRGGAS